MLLATGLCLASFAAYMGASFESEVNAAIGRVGMDTDKMRHIRAKALASSMTWIKIMPGVKIDESVTALEEGTQGVAVRRVKARRMGIEVWEGGKSMPIRHLRRTVETMARHMGIAPHECVQTMLEICAVESDLGEIIRQKNGPALSPWQIEPKSWDHLLDTLRKKHPEWHRKLEVLYRKDRSQEWNRSRNIPYACASAIVFVSLKYPSGFKGLNNIQKRAALWKKWYNTPRGKGTVDMYYEKSLKHAPEKGPAVAKR